MDLLRLGDWSLLAVVGSYVGLLITAPNSSDGRQTHGHRHVSPSTDAGCGCETGPTGGAAKLHLSVWLVGDPVRNVGAVILEADVLWMRLICIAVSAGRCISRRQVYLFPMEAPLCSSSPAVSGNHPSTHLHTQ